MHTLAMTIHRPPVGALKQSGSGSNPTAEQLSEANTVDANFENALVPFLQSLPDRPPRRSGNVRGFDLLGPVKTATTYLLLLSVDTAQGAVDDNELLGRLPAGSQVSVLGEFELLESVWHPQKRSPRSRRAFTMRTPPVGELEAGGDGSNPTAEQLSEEKTGRDALLKAVVPFLRSLLPDQPHSLHQSIISGFDLFGIDQWSKLNNYLLLLTADALNVDVGGDDLLKVLPGQSQVSVLGDFGDRAQQPHPFAFGSDDQPRGGFL